MEKIIAGNKLPDGCFELVYNSAGIKTTETPDTIPTTIGDTEWKKLLSLKNDTNPRFKIETFKIPCEGTGGVYEVPFFESFNERIASKLLPGDKFGHEFISRPPSDFYTVGSKITKDANGQQYENFKIYIPPKGFTTDNDGFICDAEMGLVHFSLVSKPAFNMMTDDDGNPVRHFYKSLGRERNDAVEYGGGAMEQVVNSAGLYYEGERVCNENEWTFIEFNQIGPVDAYRNFHSARIRDPGDFRQDGAWANKTIDKDKGIQLVVGQLKNPPKGQEGSMVAQAYRFPIDKFSPDEAKKWCKDHDIKYIKFTVGKDYGKQNAQSVRTLSDSVDNARSLINAGKFDRASSWKFTTADGDKLLGANGDDWATFAKWHLAEDTSESEETKARYKYPYGKNGKVYRSALRAIASRASAHGLSDLSDTASELLKLLDSKKSNGGRRMDNFRDECETLKNAVDNGSVNWKDVAAAVGLSGHLRNENDDKNAEIMKQLNSALGNPADIVATITALMKNAKEYQNAAAENAVITAFGTPKIRNGKNEEVENLAYTRAKELCNGKTGDELAAVLKNAADDPFIKRFRSEMADNGSTFNAIEGGKQENKGEAMTFGSGSVIL